MRTHIDPNTPFVNAWTGMADANRIEFPANNPDEIEIWLYTDEMSYAHGDDVAFRVHTNAPTYSLVIEREGGEVEEVHRVENLEGVAQQTPEDAYAVGCGWSETYRLTIPDDWRSGVYVVTAVAEGGEKGRWPAEHFFVVRAQPDRKAKMVLVLATCTYTAYNDWGGANHYRSLNTDVPAPVLSTQRPWAMGFVRIPAGVPRLGGVDRTLEPFAYPRFPDLEWALTNHYSRHYGDAGLGYYDGPFLRWIEQQGYQIDVLTQHDLHFRPESLEGYQLIIMTGHEEYSTWETFDAVEAHLARGGNVARFSGNYLWQSRLENDGHTQITYKNPYDDPVHATEDKRRTTTLWEHPLVSRSLSASFGLSGNYGVYHRHGGAIPRGAGGYTIYRPGHWALEGTDLYFGDVLGGNPTNIVAFEVDGLDFTFRDGLPYPTFRDGAPADTEIIGLVPAIKCEEEHLPEGTARWVNAALSEFQHLDAIIDPFLDQVADGFKVPAAGEMWRSIYGNSAMITCTVGQGTVFYAGTSCWVHGLLDRDFAVEQITKNVLNRLSD